MGRKSEWIDRRASHLAEIDITEELEDGQISDARVVLTRAVENVIQHFNHLWIKINKIRKHNFLVIKKKNELRL